MRGLTGYHIMIVSKYLKTIIDFINLELVCKKFGGNMEKFHFNPIPLNSKTLGYFPNIETLHLWDEGDENFGNGFMTNTKENEDIENEIVLKREFFESLCGSMLILKLLTETKVGTSSLKMLLTLKTIEINLVITYHQL
ncbi:hypothetical protein EIN_438930 [Entamoeba invadens IP1]|uniref:Uncharacterized protein n=1 Tax=Entamoeba invadens IP1 TaxID=370355 RepID=A0A0A1TUR9_ENTIV|nr:hypothetical protein EIN_438930 [Entamoeba invadens IP1]ELP83879.1 hypothetical protein EIN_438930 [Entamoeba invadens IP1]|eukprot:XP_004183225.1 hypothetical protein EIN_438930 [Entamoeba invadens IP1]